MPLLSSLDAEACPVLAEPHGIVFAPRSERELLGQQAALAWVGLACRLGSRWSTPRLPTSQLCWSLREAPLWQT